MGWGWSRRTRRGIPLLTNPRAVRVLRSWAAEPVSNGITGYAAPAPSRDLTCPVTRVAQSEVGK